jgi:hypothetical protein
MEAILLKEILLNEIRQNIHIVRRVKGDLATLRNSVIAAKGGVRGMVGQKDWSEVIKEAKNLAHFLVEDTLGMMDLMCMVSEDIDELNFLLDDMRI